MSSLKQQQSEAGVTGDPSPNYELSEKIGQELFDKFDHTHGTITNNDAYIFVCQLKLGDTYDKSQGCMNVKLSMKGCYNDVCEMFVSMIGDNPWLKSAMIHAIMKSES